MDLINEDIEAQNSEANGKQEQASKSEEKNESMSSWLKSPRIRKIPQGKTGMATKEGSELHRSERVS
jgi:hypothetical protein